MKRLFACAVAGCVAAGAFSTALAARHKSEDNSKQSLRIPAVRVSTRSEAKGLRAPKLPPQAIKPIPEDPQGPIFKAPLPADPVTHEVEHAGHIVLPPDPVPPVITSPLPPTPAMRPVLPPVVQGPVIHEPPVIDFQPVVEAPGIELFERVRYTSTRKMAPNAVKKLVIIRDPSQPKRTAVECRNCVAIEICVPPCKCETVKANKAENVVRYNYGKYGVEIRVKKGRVVVQYHARAKA